MFKNVGKMMRKMFTKQNTADYSKDTLTEVTHTTRKVPEGKGSWNLRHQRDLQMDKARKKRRLKNKIARKSRAYNRKAA